jgi:hypothetical protein
VLWNCRAAPVGESGVETAFALRDHPNVVVEAFAGNERVSPVMHPLQTNVYDTCVEFTYVPFAICVIDSVEPGAYAAA